MRISDWSSDVCSSDLLGEFRALLRAVHDDAAVDRGDTGGLVDLREAERGRVHRDDAGTRADDRRTEGDLGEFAKELLGDEEAPRSADRPQVVAGRAALRSDVGLRVSL